MIVQRQKDQNMIPEKRQYTAPMFTPKELAAMHGWCCGYRDMVHLGIRPAPEQDARFMRWSRICYRCGVAYGR